MTIIKMSTKRKRMTKVDKAQLREQIVDELNDHYPQSIRHVFYRMTDPRLPCPIPKTNKGYIKVQGEIKQMRREGIIPFSKIVDPSRSVICGAGGYDSPASFLEGIEYRYYKDMWADSDYHVEVWAESLSIAGVLEDVCSKYSVDLFPSKGFSSDTFIYEAAKHLKDKTDYGKQITIIYIGDYDPSGKIIDTDIRGKLCNHILGNGWDDYDKHEAYEELEDLRFFRLAINEDQIEEYDLPTKPRKEGDKRMPNVKETVEAEAMPVEILTDMVDTFISSIIPERDELLEDQEIERQSIIKALRPLNRPCDYEDGKYIYDDDGKLI